VPQGRTQVREQRAAVRCPRRGHGERLLKEGDSRVEVAGVPGRSVPVAQRVAEVGQVRRVLG
jgi:uncharacterized Zn-binding protein involved in type VI secretion